MGSRTKQLSRGHLSRPACSHVKQVAKRPGTRVPGREFFSGRFFVGWRMIPKNGYRFSEKIMRKA
jgi:hypothetical protein